MPTTRRPTRAPLTMALMLLLAPAASMRGAVSDEHLRRRQAQRRRDAVPGRLPRLERVGDEPERRRGAIGRSPTRARARGRLDRGREPLRRGRRRLRRHDGHERRHPGARRGRRGGDGRRDQRRPGPRRPGDRRCGARILRAAAMRCKRILQAHGDYVKRIADARPPARARRRRVDRRRGAVRHHLHEHDGRRQLPDDGDPGGHRGAARRAHGRRRAEQHRVPERPARPRR